MSDSREILREQLTQGLLHQDHFVRDACLEYWKKQTDRGSVQAGKIIAAIDTFGLLAFPWPHFAYSIQLDRGNFESLTGTLGKAKFLNNKEKVNLGRWLKWCLSAEPEVLPEVDRFLNSQMARNLAAEGFVPISELLEGVGRKRRHETFDLKDCYAAIEQVFVNINLASKNRAFAFPREAVSDAISLLNRLVPLEAVEKLQTLASAWLALHPENNSGDCSSDYKFVFGVYLAGKIGLISGIDQIIEGINFDWDWLNETSAEVLCQMPARESTARLRERWWHLPEHGRLFFAEVFEVAHLPEHRDFYLENMGREHHYECIPYSMASALALLGDKDSIALAAEFWEQNEYDREANGIAEILYAIYTLREEKSQLVDKIQDAIMFEQARSSSRENLVHKFSTQSQGKAFPGTERLPAVQKTTKVGRNDACPCGSGKKYKKCCL